MTDEQRHDRASREARAARRLWRVPRTLLTGVLGAWLVLVLGLLVLGLALAAGWRSEELKTLIEWVASEALDHELRIGRLEGSILSTLRAHEISLSPRGAAADPSAVLRIRSIGIDLDVARSLREQRVVLDSVVIEGPRLAISRARDGSVEITGWASGARARDRRTGRVRIGVAIETLAIRDAELALEIGSGAMADPLRAKALLQAKLSRIRWHSGDPPAWPGSGQVDLALEQLAWRDHELGTGSMSWELMSHRMKLREVRLSGPLGELTGTGALAFSGSPKAAVIAEARADLHFEDVDLDHLRPRALKDSRRDRLHSQLAGELAAELTWSAGERERRPRIEVHGTLEPSRLGGGRVEAGEIHGSYRLDTGAWTFERARLEIAAGQISARGHGTRSDIGLLEVRTAQIELGELPAGWLPISGLSGRVALELEFSGAWNDPVGSLELTGTALRMGQIGPARLELALSALRDDLYRLDSLSITLDEQAERMPGGFLRSRQPASLRIGPRGVEVSDLGLDWSGGALAISGGFEDGRLLPTHVDLRSLDWAIVSMLGDIRQGLAGEMSGTLELSGSPRRPNVSADLLWLEPRLSGLAANRVALSLESNDEFFAASAGVTRGEREELRLEARLAQPLDLRDPRALLADPRTSLELEASEFDLHWLSPLFAGQRWRPGGRVDGKLSLVGALPFPHVEGGLRIRNGRLSRDSATGDGAATLLAGPLSCGAEFGGTSLRIEDMQLGEGRTEMAARARIEWQSGEELQVDFEAALEGVGFAGRLETSGGLRGDELRPTLLSLHAFDAHEISALAGIGLDLGGQLSAELVLSGQLQSPDLAVRASWEEPRIGRAGADRLVLRATSHDQQLDVEMEFIRRGGRELSVDARLPLHRTRPLGEIADEIRAWPFDAASRARLQADRFDLGWLAFLAPRLSVRTRGEVDGVLTIEGDRPIPRVAGELALRDGVFPLAGQRASAGPLDGTLRFAGSRADFDRLTLASSKGRSEISGGLEWSASGIGDVHLDILFEHFLFDQLGLLRTTLDGRLVATGPLDALEVTGGIQLGDIRVSFPSPEDPVLKEIRVLGLPEASERASIEEGEKQIAGLDENTSVDVTFAMPPGTWVRGMGLDAEIVGQVRVTKAFREALRYRGNLEVEHGRYTLQGKRFELERGAAMFVGDERAIPDVDILATRQASREVRVTAHLTGPASEPHLVLTSEPPMDEAEIISYVFLGRSQDGKTGDPSSGLGTGAASAVGNLLVDSLAPELRERLRVDQISVTSGSRNEAPAVEIESQITPDVYLRVIQSLGATADEAVEVRWRFWRNFNLESKVRRTGASSIDLLWSHDYWGLDNYGLGGLTEPPSLSGREPSEPPAPE